ncbi:hypothetical protein SEA_SOOS_26 [Gordonia phage Soos]|nr:hypothetical protein SEA_SOOS_26 [Gordonia phage Soos]
MGLCSQVTLAPQPKGTTLFHGSVPADLRSIIREHSHSWKDSDVWVGCSGNFTIERVIHGHVKAIHSNDVQGYSSALGFYLAGGDVPFHLKDEHLPELEWLLPYLETPEGKLASIMLGTRFLQWVGKGGLYYKRMLNAYRDQFPEIHQKTVDKIVGANMRVASYHAKDVREWIADDVPEQDVVAMFPPFFAGDYESQFAMIDKFFDWPEPEYPELDEAGKDELVQQVMDRPHWLMGLHIEREELRPYLRGRVQTSNRGVPIHVYSSGSTTRIVRPRQDVEPIRMPKISTTDEIHPDSVMKIHPLTSGQFAMIRSQFMAKSIKPGSPLLACGVSVDGKIIGAFAYLPPKFNPDELYLMSDFPVSWSKYKHLAKLVIVAAMSEEGRFLAQRSLSSIVNSLSTTAFSNRPVSMKYRGLMKLHSRKPADDGMHENQLHYVAQMGEWNLQEGIAMWHRKWGKTR